MNLPPSRQIVQNPAASAQRNAGRSPKSRMSKWLVASAALSLILGALWYSISATDSEFGKKLSDASGAIWQRIGISDRPTSVPTAAQRPSAAAPVRVAEAVRRDLAVIRRTPGTVIANTSVQITSRVEGIIDSAGFREGQFVKKGDLLFQIDPRPFQAALDQAKAQVARDAGAARDRSRATA